MIIYELTFNHARPYFLKNKYALHTGSLRYDLRYVNFISVFMYKKGPINKYALYKKMLKI